MLILRRSFLTLATGLTPTACRTRRSSQGARLRAGLSPYLSVSPFYLAMERGYFSEAGFQVETERTAGAAQMIPLLAGGRLDVAFPSLSPAFLSAVARGAALKIVAGRARSAPGCSDAGILFGNRKAFPRGLADLRQLKGKRVAYLSKAGLGEFYLDVLLGTAGLTSDDVILVGLRHEEASAALIGGKIDAMISASGFGRELDEVSSEVIRGIGVAEVLPDFQYSHVVFGRALLNGDPAVGKRFLRVLLRATREYVSGETPKFIEAFARSNGLDPETVRKKCRANLSLDGAIDLDSLQRFIDWSARKNYSPASLKAADVVDTRFLEGA